MRQAEIQDDQSPWSPAAIRSEELRRTHLSRSRGPSSGKGHGKVVEGKGASMDVQEWNRTTTLMYASKRRYGEVVEVLLWRGASVEVQDKDVAC